MELNDDDMREYVRALVRDVIRKHSLPQRPPWRDVIAALNLPYPIKGNLLPGQDGCKVEGSKQIIVSSTLTCKERIVFTIFHEILHVLIEDDGRIEGELGDHFYVKPDDNAEKRVLENLCNVGAAEFIMPREQFLPMVRDNGWLVKSIGTIAATFGCSHVAAGFQFALSHPKQCVLLICEYGIPPNMQMGALIEVENHEECCLFAAYTACSPAVKYPMRRYVTIPRDHLIHQIWQCSGDCIETTYGLYASGKRWPIHCEIAYINGKVYAGFFEDGNVAYYSGGGQLSIFND